MKRIWIIVTLVVVALGLLLSFWLVPGEQETALIDYKDQRLDSARAVFEAELETGQVSPTAANGLVELYLQYGEIDKAIGVMELYVQQNPDDILAWTTLGRLYRDAQRPDDYIRTVERVNQLQPNDERLRELTELYNYTEQFEKHLPAMEQLVERSQVNEASSYLNLANVQANEKNYAAAAETLRKMRQTYPGEFSFTEVEFLASVLMDAGMEKEAYQEVETFVFSAETIPPAQIARLVNILHFKGSPEYAWDILSKFPEDQIKAYPELFSEYVLLKIDRGEHDEAYALMRERYDAGEPLPRVLIKDFIYQAAMHDDMEIAYTVAAQVEAIEFSESELLSMLEVALIKGDSRLLTILAGQLEPVAGHESYPLVTEALAIAGARPGGDEAVKRVVAMELDVPQDLQMARICYQSQRIGCVRQLIAGIDNPDTMNNAELENAVELMVASGNLDRAEAWINVAEQAGRGSESLEQMRVNIYAARGDSEALQAWLAENDPSAERYGNLFFMAYDNGQYDTAVMIGEKWHAAFPSGNTRRLLISAHTNAGNPGAALALLRGIENRTASENDDYLSMLVKLSKNNPAYRAELAEQARLILRGNVSDQRKKAMIYTLIDAGRADIAMPYIREFAMSEGGDWAELYAGYLDDAGRSDEARDFRMQLAQDPSASPQLKREIAFVLLERGYTDDALLLFGELAANAPAASPDVQQLFYLWGPRFSPEQLAWIGARAQSAPSAEEAARWYDYAASYSTQADLARFVETYPQSLGSAQVSQRYVAYLMESGDPATAQQIVLAKAQETDNPLFLESLADTAEDYGMKELAQSLYLMRMERYGESPNAVRHVGVLAYAQADYTNARRYLSQYVSSLQGGEFAPTADDYMAHYYYAELLREQEPELASAHYELAYNGAMALGTPSSLSTAAQARMRLGDVAGGSELFEQLIAANPNDRLLRADYAGMLVETENYDTARQVIEYDIQTRAQPMLASADGIPLQARNLEGYYLSEDGQELILQYGATPQQNLHLSQSELQRHDWLQYGSESYDRALLVAKPGYRMYIQPVNAQYMVRAEPAPVAAQTAAQQQVDLRYALLDARIDLETGREYAAVRKLESIDQYYPADAQLMGFTANAYNYAGHWKRALKMLDAAGSITPQNEDIAELRRNIWLLHAPHVKADYEWVGIGDSDYDVFTVSGFTDINDHVEVGGLYAMADLDAQGVRNAQGVIGNYEEEQQQAEVYVALTQDNGNRLQGSLFANEDTLGLGAYYGFITELGATTLLAELHRPNWDYIEGLLGNANRDRIGLQQLKKLSPRLAVGGGLNYNRYNLEDMNDVARTVGVNGQVVYELQNEGPYLAAAYNLDAEYRTDIEERIAPDTTPYNPLPLNSREVHTVSLLGNYDFTRNTEADFQAGYSVDRLSGHGPVLAGALTHRMLNDQLEAQVRASYGARTAQSEGDTKRAGGYLKWRF